jgi:hypothetical protein
MKAQVFARIGFSDVVVPIEQQDDPSIKGEDSYLIGFELEDGTECDEEGNPLE